MKNDLPTAHACSADGTSIAHWRTGEGPPLVLVHGATADHTTTWSLAAPLLARHFTVYAMDRRGRGASGDGAEYDLRREAEDVAAVIAHVGRPVRLIGHSFGGLCALEASRLSDGIEKLVLYEGVSRQGILHGRPELLEKLRTLATSGDYEGVLRTVFLEALGLPEPAFQALRANEAAWRARLANTPPFLRELEAEEAYVFDAARFADLHTPTLLLVGETSPQTAHDDAAAVAAALPNAQVQVIPGQGHGATYQAPDVFVESVLPFLTR